VISDVTKLPVYSARNERMRARRKAGWTLDQIGDAEGLTHQRASQICEGVVPRVAVRVCSGCRKRIERRSATGMCRSCLAAEGYTSVPRRWTEESIRRAFVLFYEHEGHAPRATDLSPAMARRTGHPEQAERFAEGDLPSLQIVTRRFGGLNAAIRAAGLPTRKPGERLAVARRAP
jgi:hypothetical protein